MRRITITDRKTGKVFHYSDMQWRIFWIIFHILGFCFGLFMGVLVFF